MQFYPAGQPADLPAGMEESDSDDEPVVAASGRHHAKPRRKAHQRPQGSDQIRQAFSKRKKGLVLKSYQLFRLTDAKVFMFVVNDKGSSWAYATPGFGAPLAPEVLRQLRDMAGVGDAAHAKCHTEVMPHPSIADHDPATDDRSLYVASRGVACLGSRSAEAAQTTGGFAVPAAGAVARGGRAGSSMSGASGDAELSGDGSRTRAAGTAAAAAGALAGTPPKSRGALGVKEEPEDAAFARPASGLSAVTLAPIPGLPNFSRSAGCPADAAQAPDMAMADVAPQQLTMMQAQQQQQQYMQQVLPQQQQALFGMPVAGATPGFVMGEAMVELMGPGATGVFVSQPLPLMTGAVAVPLQQLAPLPLAPQMPVGSPPGSPYARPRGPSPGPGAGDPFSSLQSRLTPVRTRLQQGWPEDAGAAQVSSAPAGMVNLMLGPGPMPLVDSTAGIMAPQQLQAQSSPLKPEQQKMVFGTALAGSGATSSGGTPTMGGGPSAATAMFSRFGGPAAAARLADGSTEPSPTASIGRGFAALAVDSMPGTPVYPDATFMAASGAPAYCAPAWQDQQMRVAAGGGASAPAACASVPPAAAAPLAVPLPAPGPDDDAFLDDPILAGLWGCGAPAAASTHPPASPPSSSLPSPRQLSGSSCCGSGAVASAGMGAMLPMQPVQPMEQQQQMQMQMQQVAMQLQALQQQQAVMQQQLMTQREQAAATAVQLQAASPPSGSGAPGTPGSSPVSRERLLDALSAQISAMPPEMRAQLQMQLEGAGPAPPAPPPPAAPADLPPAPPRPLQAAAAVAPLPPLANMLHGPSRLSSSTPAAPPAAAGTATAAAGPGPAGVMPPPLDCSSPLKRGLPSLGGSLAAPDDGGSPLKRLRARLPEPPSFATLVQTEMSIDDAVAWALQASFSGAVRAPDGSVIAHLGSEDILARLGDPDWAPPAE